MADQPLSDIDFKNKMASVWTTLNRKLAGNIFIEQNITIENPIDLYPRFRPWNSGQEYYGKISVASKLKLKKAAFSLHKLLRQVSGIK